MARYFWRAIFFGSILQIRDVFSPDLRNRPLLGPGFQKPGKSARFGLKCSFRRLSELKKAILSGLIPYGRD